MASFDLHPSSYRDPAGFLFYKDETLYRQVNQSFQKDFDEFLSSGLSKHLIDAGLLVPFETINENLTGSSQWHQTLKPEPISFISYPYEWCFDMLKDAALVTLEVALEAIKFNMLLKDASAYNLQWHKGRMQLLDTLSFEHYNEQKPWIAYRQFCEHFLTPLSLMHYLQMPMQPLQLAYPDGIPLAVTKKLLPGKSKWNLHLFLHIHLQARLATKTSGKKEEAKPFSKTKMLRLLKSLQQSIASFSFNRPSGVWSGYYEEAAQREDYIKQKKEIVDDWLSQLNVSSAIDAGANEGEFSLLLTEKNIATISADFDHYAINQLYQKIKNENRVNIHPVIIDFSNPSPAIGVNNEERFSFLERVNTDLVLALALIHHLSIGKNIDFGKIVKMFRSMGKTLIIEFVPKQDEKIKQMLQHKRDVYDWYTKENFLNAFSSQYKIVQEKLIGTSGRSLFLMESS